MTDTHTEHDRVLDALRYAAALADEALRVAQVEVLRRAEARKAIRDRLDALTEQPHRYSDDRLVMPGYYGGPHEINEPPTHR